MDVLVQVELLIEKSDHISNLDVGYKGDHVVEKIKEDDLVLEPKIVDSNNESLTLEVVNTFLLPVPNVKAIVIDNFIEAVIKDVLEVADQAIRKAEAAF